MFLFPRHGKPAEFKENIIQHISFFPCDAFGDVHTVPCEALQCRILGTAPGLYADAANTGKVSNDEGINPVIFIQGVKRFLISFYFLWVKAVYMGGESSQFLACGEVICNMYPVKSSGFHSNDEILELMVLFQDTSNHGLKLPGPALCIWDGFHPDKKILVEINGRDNICTGTNVDPDKKR